MKALILSAGFGTRLAPYTDRIPKPLFTINNRPLLDRLIHQLRNAGCTAVAINTHHLHEKFEDFFTKQTYDIPVHLQYEPNILGPGGAIKNLANFWDVHPFIVVNGDVVCDIDFRAVYEYHASHAAPATLVLTNDPQFNGVSVDAMGYITGFHASNRVQSSSQEKRYTFSGIHVMNPSVIDRIPENTFYNFIDTYRELITEKNPPMAFWATGNQWTTIDSPRRYRSVAMQKMAKVSFANAFGDLPDKTEISDLGADGSDRTWHRISSKNESLVVADHGIRKHDEFGEVDAFVAIAAHLISKGIRVPRIHGYDLFAGMVFMDDLGDTHLQQKCEDEIDSKQIVIWYQSVIDLLLTFFVKGAIGFKSKWAYQTPEYNHQMVVNECRYFESAFVRGFLGEKNISPALTTVYAHLATQALTKARIGLMHRDYQSRNIMIKDETPFIIDFQGARKGPFEYDLASLLIDPYVKLSEAVQTQLLNYATACYCDRIDQNTEVFRRNYIYCCVARNLHVLGAFGFLSRVKGKKKFEIYIPHALETLKKNLARLNDPMLSELTRFVEKL